ncbi:MAG: hypothetical protein DLM70_05915, partial [Chloroflexi bacterium]
MNPTRVAIWDLHPVFDRNIVHRPLNLIALGAALASATVQVTAVWQTVSGFRGPAVHLSQGPFSAAAAVWLALGLLVFLQRRAGRVGPLFLISASFGAIFSCLLPLRGFLELYSLLCALGLLMFPAFLFSFVRAYNERRHWVWPEAAVYVLALVLVPSVAQGLIDNLPNLLWRIGIAFVVACLLGSIAQLLLTFRERLTPAVALQTRALLFGLIAGTTPSAVVYALPVLTTGNTSTSLVWLPVVILVFLLTVGYALLVFELNEADLVVRRTLVYGAVGLLIAGAYGLTWALLSGMSLSSLSLTRGLASLLVILAVIASFPLASSVGRRAVDWLLYGGRSDRWELLQQLSSRLSAVMPPLEVGRLLSTGIVSGLELRGATVFERVGERFVASGDAAGNDDSTAVPMEVADMALGQPASPLLLRHKRPLLPRAKNDLDPRYEFLARLPFVLIIPIVARSRVEMLLCLEAKKAHDGIDADDLNLLAPLMRQANTSLENALLLGDLERKVEELRLAHARIANEQEAERARLARELHDGTSQELSNVITLVSAAKRQIELRDDASQTLDRLQSAAEEAYEGVRRSSHALLPVA